MKKLLGLAALAAATLSMPAHALSLVGDFGNAAFSYGSLTDTGFANYTFYNSAASQCLGIGDCYVGGDTYAIIADASSSNLLVHPAPGTGGNSAIGYTASSAGFYKLDAIATSLDYGTKGVGYFTILSGILTTYSSGSITGGNPGLGTSANLSSTVALGAGDTLGLFISNFDGNYFNDSTAVSGTLGAVPEPISWAMMVGGFGLLGASMRRRRVNTTYA